jgi:hypothetical protein
MLKNLSIAAAAIATLSGCTSYSGNPSDCQARQGGIPAVLTIRGCSIQLTPDWAVSAKHEPLRQLLPNGIADEQLDLYFFPHFGEAPIWRQPVPGEAVTAKGNPWNPLDLTGLTAALPMRESASGTVKGIIPVQPNGYPAPMQTVVFDARAIEGYSGGPIVGTDGAVLGLIWANVTSKPTSNDTGVDLAVGDGLAIPAEQVMQAFHRDVGQSLSSKE